MRVFVVNWQYYFGARHRAPRSYRIALAVELGLPSFFQLTAAVLMLFSSQALAISGGAPATLNEVRHAVMIVGSGGTFCTGVAVARDLVLTAAHCVAASTTYKLIEFNKAKEPVLLDVLRVLRHPNFNIQSLLGHRATADIALLKLAAPLPAIISPVTVGLSKRAPLPGDHYIVTGYGLTVRGDGKTGGTLRAARLVSVGKPGNLQIRLADPATKGASPGLGACTGDSGAPVFEGDALIGIVSWSTGPAMSDGCGGLTGVTPLVLYRGWLFDTARKLGSRIAP